ncbi:VPS9 domain-containing protein 1 isoform X2 [Brienomyrus brachyistius]|uniref:VPS9 domain-containing protein 1 isoform X2 n=1 Tax=Brienomyrus brachyistius TaxID=42636 RepID=UPI0020B31969|nr:VPS9 domain-containing protein 1 isoform X2 [Brienomyrus brachyistius]
MVQEAYCEYLRSISYICHALLEDAGSKQAEMVPLEVDKMLRLAEQCLERVKSFAGKKLDVTAESSPTSGSHLCPAHTRAGEGLGGLQAALCTAQPCAQVPVAVHCPLRPPAVLPAPKLESGDTPTRHRRVLSDGAGAASPFLPPEIFQKMQAVNAQDAKKELTPLEEASRLNQKLKANYEVRLARLTPGQATQKTSLTLSLQRQMMENLIIARARQDALHRKMEERRLRLQEEASRRLAAVGMITPEEQEQRVLYASVLEYEQDHDWPKMWKASLKRNPNDSTLVSGLVSYLLSCPDHPVVQLLKTLQYNIYDRLYPLVSQCPPITAPSHLAIKTSVSAQNLRSESSLPASPPSYHDHNANREGEPVLPDRENSFEDLEQFMTQMDLEPGCERRPEVVSHIQELEGLALREPLKNIVKDVHAAIDRLLSLCLLSFECLNTAASKDLCVACIEEAFFPPLWGPLLVLFRKVHRERELSFETSVRLYRNTTPAEVGVAAKLFPREPCPLRASYPYESAVQELRLLSRDLCPQRKLECIVRTLRLICACAEEYRSLQEPDAPPSTAAIGADDLLPILSYVALRTEMPQLVSECAALEEFIHEGYLIGEEGYCLTSLQSALSYVESLHLAGPQHLGPAST